VVNGPSNARRADVPVDAVSALRQRLADRITALLGEDGATAVLLAITVGATHEISRAEWERYALTGTSHLMAISGMHIAMAAGGAFLLAWAAIAPFCRRANVRDLAAIVAMAAAMAYAEISGFAVPARRAVLMASLVLCAALLRRQLSAGRLFGVTCIAIVASDPLSVHAPGFKLSFAAVAILLWVARQHRPGSTGEGASLPRRLVSTLVELGALQLTLLLGLLPLTATLFGRVAWLAPPVNLLVLPLFNLVTVPAALLGLLLDGPLSFLGDGLLHIAWWGARVLLWIVDAVAAWPRARIPVALLAPPMAPIAMLPALWAAAPPGFPGRRLAWIAAAAVVLRRSDRARRGTGPRDRAPNGSPNAALRYRSCLSQRQRHRRAGRRAVPAWRRRAPGRYARGESRRRGSRGRRRFRAS
jgi:competence protein ComEC